MKGMKKGSGKYMSDEPPAKIASRFTGVSPFGHTNEAPVRSQKKAGGSLKAGPNDAEQNSIVKKGGM